MMNPSRFSPTRSKLLPSIAAPNKKKARGVRLDGKFFGSVGEAARYLMLLSDQNAGTIQDLATQVLFRLKVGETHVTTYRADFKYILQETGALVVEDFKGEITDLYRIKKSLMHATLDIDIKETTKKDLPKGYAALVQNAVGAQKTA